MTYGKYIQKYVYNNVNVLLMNGGAHSLTEPQKTLIFSLVF